jgi:hypothetical protein
LIAQNLIFDNFGISGEDFVWFGLVRTSGELPPVGQAPVGGISSTWSWIDQSGEVGAGDMANTLGFQNWAMNEPNNNAAGFGGWGNFAGIYTAAVSPQSDIYKWGDMGPGMEWNAFYKCCPTKIPVQSTEPL